MSVVSAQIYPLSVSYVVQNWTSKLEVWVAASARLVQYCSQRITHSCGPGKDRTNSVRFLIKSNVVSKLDACNKGTKTIASSYHRKTLPLSSGPGPPLRHILAR
ncbi:hypothetical protein ElyMa_005704100 [Elysia marginata]|uniref:Uncharacterized protein n=1 Tax=Elysia marginata TaxID=1093978 RepID=A0AAV4FGG8_9GAST|nr:hypothetical protein ElyMa_005704100 [Elysia marginata]